MKENNMANSAAVVVPEHLDLTALEQKIFALFDYRLFPLLMEKINQTEEVKDAFYQNLFELQEAIYLLDAHLESHWYVDHDTRQECWKNIHRTLKKCLAGGKLTGPYLTHIEKYEKHELALREGLFPDRFAMTYFYYYKSCDVKLLRRLIYEFGRLQGKESRLSDWRMFDYVTELNDDITDVYEDKSYYNGNRFLIELIRHGKKSTMTTFKNMLQHMVKEANKKAVAPGAGHFLREIYRYTADNGLQTLALLNAVMDDINLPELKSQCVMTKYISQP